MTDDLSRTVGCRYCNVYGDHECRSPYGYGESRPVGLTDRGLTVEVACPKCGARPGKPCVVPSGVVRPDYPHLVRKKLRVRVAEHDAVGADGEHTPRGRTRA